MESYAAAKVAQIKSSKEECALDMGQRLNYAASKDVLIKLRREECVEGMEHTATQTMNQQLLRYVLGQNLRKRLCHIPASSSNRFDGSRQLTRGGSVCGVVAEHFEEV